MQLSSTDIRELLENGALKITASSPYPFDAKQQIRPSSIDVRISNTFCKFKADTVHCLDLLDKALSKAIKENPSLMYEKLELVEGDFIELKFQDILLTETWEYLEIPNSISAVLKGRSSFARLGISVHCTGDYINPGYKGRMPVQIINHSPIPVKIYPYMSLAQLVLYCLSSVPDVDYQSLPDTVYKSDSCQTEGLSLWYRDREIKKLAYRISGTKFENKTEATIIFLLERNERRFLKQLEEDFKRKQIKLPDEIDSALDNYENRDVKRDKKMRLVFWVTSILWGADLSVFIPSLIQVIAKNNWQDPIFWISFIILGFSGFILWVTFEYRYIGL